MCSEEVTGSHSVCGEGVWWGFWLYRRHQWAQEIFSVCVVLWRLGSERECVHVCVHVQGVYAPEKGLSVPSLESAWQ